MAEVSLAEKLKEIDERTEKIEQLLTGLIRSVARIPDGRTLTNVVANIERIVKDL